MYMIKTNKVMKTNKFFAPLLTGALALGGIIFTACSGQSSGSAVATSDSASVATISQETALAVDSTASYLTWKGFKPGGEHFGKLPVSHGQVATSAGKLYGGYVEIAMNGIIVEDIQGEMAATLKAHLENEDFFETATYPTSRFELTDLPSEGADITSLKELKGNLTLKDVTKNITIPVKGITAGSDGSLRIESEVFRINRADWNVKYGSRSFFTGLGDKFIHDEIELSFVLLAR